MSTVWSFGCSFTSGYLEVPVEKTYPYMVAKEFNYSVKNFARPGNCNDKIFFDLLKRMNQIENNDIVLFQFSSFNRVGFFKSDDPNSYFSSAGIPELGPKHKNNEPEFKEFKINDLEVLLDYITTWQPLRRKFTIENTITLLEGIKTQKNITYITLFLTNESLYFDSSTLVLPTDKNSSNLSINDYLDHNQLTIGHEYPEKYPYGDTHPGFSGHEVLAKKLIEKIK